MVLHMETCDGNQYGRHVPDHRPGDIGLHHCSRSHRTVRAYANTAAFATARRR